MNRILASLDLENGRKIEYTMVGNGPPILVMHGGHSNCYEDLGYQALVDQGFSIITPSRPGYGETSADIGHNLELAVTAYAELLHHLQINQVHVVAFSAGGPSGLLLASRYPAKVKTLTLQSAVTGEWLTKKDKEYKAAYILFRPFIEKGTWTFLNWMSYWLPWITFRSMAASFSTLPYLNIETELNNADIKRFCAMNKRQRSKKGFLIDLKQTKTIYQKDIQAIKCPVLVMHSRYDSSVSLEHAYHIKKHIPHARLCVLDSWGHLIWLGSNSQYVDEKVTDFLVAPSFDNCKDRSLCHD